MSEHWLSFLIGIGSSIVATATIAAGFLMFCRPNIKISPFIAMQTLNGQTVYCFKFINSSSIFQASEVNCDVTCASPATGSSGTTLTHTPISFKKTLFQSIPKKKNLESADFAIQIGTFDDIQDLLQANPSSYLIIKIRAKNLFSGLSKSFEKRLNSRDIKAGHHCHGENLEVA